MNVEERIRAVAVNALGPSSRWAILVERSSAGFVAHAEHPASAGMVMELGTFEEHAATEAVQQWVHDREFAVADAAPDLEHRETAHGVRALTTAFEWPTVQVRAVAFLLFQAGCLTPDEAGWLAGYAASDAPMSATPPT